MIRDYLRLKRRHFIHFWGLILVCTPQLRLCIDDWFYMRTYANYRVLFGLSTYLLACRKKKKPNWITIHAWQLTSFSEKMRSRISSRKPCTQYIRSNYKMSRGIWELTSRDSDEIRVCLIRYRLFYVEMCVSGAGTYTLGKCLIFFPRFWWKTT